MLDRYLSNRHLCEELGLMHDSVERQLDEALRLRTSADIGAATTDLVAEIGGGSRPSPPLRDRFSRRTVAILSTVLVLSGATATAAVAAPKVVEWFTFDPDVSSTLVLDTGMTCTLEYVLTPDQVASDESDKAIESAKEYLRSLDLNTLPLDERLAEIEADPENPFNATEEGARVGYALFGLVVADLSAHGHSSGISVEGSSDCRPGTGE